MNIKKVMKCIEELNEIQSKLNNNVLHEISLIEWSEVRQLLHERCLHDIDHTFQYNI